MKKQILCLLAALIILMVSAYAQTDLPVDKKATRETIVLYNKLKKLLNKGIMFGHQDDLAYGVGWKYEEGRSDIKDVTGDYPAVYGWELGHLELDKEINLDSVPFNRMKQFILQGYDRGGVITISWHLNNPLNGKSAWDAAPGTVISILPGGPKHELYKSWLDKLSVFLLSLKDKKGRAIPVIFRPFHELNGSWFWWGKNHCTPAELIQLYRFTASYLKDLKNVHQLLYAYNTDRFATKEEYLERYPGDDWIDLVGFDIYQQGGVAQNERFAKELSNTLDLLEEIAAERNKIPALTEFGFNEVPDSNWWTGTFWKAIEKHKISYVLAWRNATNTPKHQAHYFVPHKGQLSAEDFVKFYQLERTLFGNDIANEKLYKE